MGLFGRRSKQPAQDEPARREEAPAGPSPRCQHSTFAHHAFRQVAFRDAGKLIHALGLLEGPRLVRELWDTVALNCAARGMPPEPEGDRPKVHPRRIADCPAVLLEMPAPLAPTETHFVAAVLLPGEESEEPEGERIRYYTLERTAGGEQTAGAAVETVIGEWNARGGHRLVGPGPKPELEAFEQVLGELVAPQTEGAAG